MAAQSAFGARQICFRRLPARDEGHRMPEQNGSPLRIAGHNPQLEHDPGHTEGAECFAIPALSEHFEQYLPSGSAPFADIIAFQAFRMLQFFPRNLRGSVLATKLSTNRYLPIQETCSTCIGTSLSAEYQECCYRFSWLQPQAHRNSVLPFSAVR